MRARVLRLVLVLVALKPGGHVVGRQSSVQNSFCVNSWLTSVGTALTRDTGTPHGVCESQEFQKEIQTARDRRTTRSNTLPRVNHHVCVVYFRNS